MGAPQRKEDTVVLEREKLKKPQMYAAILINDDYTPMDFVVHVIVRFFNKTDDQATLLMMDIHNKGEAVCGVFSKEVAETKVNQVIQCAQANNYPLQGKIEPV